MSLCSSLFNSGIPFTLLYEVVLPSKRTLPNELITHFAPIGGCFNREQENQNV